MNGPNRQDVAETIWNTSRADEGTISATGAEIVADAMLALFAEALRAARAEAWDEGYSSCNEYQNAYVPAPRPNPYERGAA